MKPLKVLLFFNNTRGLKVLNFLRKKKDINIENIYLSKKNLNTKIVNNLKLRKLKFGIINFNDLNSLKKIIFKKKIDLNLLCGFPYILEEKLFNKPKYGTLNLHAGPLPQYRGGSPLNWQIINAEKKIGLSVIKVNKKIDGGPLVSKYFFKLKKNYDIKKVHEISNEIFPGLLYKSIKKIITKKPFLKTNNKKSMYFPQRTENDGQIDWKNKNSKKIYDFVRALSKPYPGAFTLNKYGKKIYIYKCSIAKIKTKDMELGQVIKVKENYYVKTKKNFIKILSFKGSLKNMELLQVN